MSRENDRNFDEAVTKALWYLWLEYRLCIKLSWGFNFNYWKILLKAIDNF